MRAITEIPANTPKPIGRTDSFFPGSVNAAACEVAGETAAAGATGVGEADKLLEEDAGGGVAAGTVDTPLTIAAGFGTKLVVDILLLLLLVEDVVWDEVVTNVVVDGVAGGVDRVLHADHPDVPFIPPEEPPPLLPPVFPPEPSSV